jgi:hypothetical protein
MDPISRRKVEEGEFLSKNELIRLDATICWTSAEWAAVDMVANHLITAGVIPPAYFDFAQRRPEHPSRRFAQYGSNYKTLEGDKVNLARYLHNHCALWYNQSDEILPSADIVCLEGYSRPLQWLMEACLFGKVPRVELEKVLAAVPSIGFQRECH